MLRKYLISSDFSNKRYKKHSFAPKITGLHSVANCQIVKLPIREKLATHSRRRHQTRMKRVYFSIQTGSYNSGFQMRERCASVSTVRYFPSPSENGHTRATAFAPPLCPIFRISFSPSPSCLAPVRALSASYVLRIFSLSIDTENIRRTYEENTMRGRSGKGADTARDGVPISVLRFRPQKEMCQNSPQITQITRIFL